MTPQTGQVYAGNVTRVDALRGAVLAHGWV